MCVIRTAIKVRYFVVLDGLGTHYTAEVHGLPAVGKFLFSLHKSRGGGEDEERWSGEGNL